MALEAGNEDKLKGNESFKKGQYVEAIGHYSQAITKVSSPASHVRWMLDTAAAEPKERDFLP
jgi:hypothetical protein